MQTDGRAPPIYVINLARRPDRLANVVKELGDAGLKFDRVEAVDGQTADPALLAARFADKGLPIDLSPGEKACGLSHFRALEQFLSSPDAAQARHAIVLEDDVHLAPYAGRLLSSLDWIPDDVGLLKIERLSIRPKPMLIGPPRPVDGHRGYQIAPLVSQHLGCTAYIVSRSAASELLKCGVAIEVPIDLYMFHPAYSPVFQRLKPMQLLPQLVEHSKAFDKDSDLGTGRKQVKPRGALWLKRLVLKAYFWLRLTRIQIVAQAFAQARWTTLRPLRSDEPEASVTTP